MSIYKGEDMIAGPTQQKFVRKPAWSRAVAVATLDTTGYTAPADGILIGSGGSGNGANGGRFIYINGTKFSEYGCSAGAVIWPIWIQLNQGDVVTTNAVQWGDFKFVPFEDSIIGDPITITPEYIRNLHDPDWSQAESLTATQINNGYNVTKRGIFIGFCSCNTPGVRFKVNGVTVAIGNAYTDYRISIPTLLVNVGDIVTTGGNTVGSEIQFVPYKQQ